MKEETYQFSENCLVHLPVAYTMIKVKSGIVHIVNRSGLAYKTYCRDKFVTGTNVPQAPAQLNDKCQHCIMKMPSHWLHYTGGYAGSAINANRGDGDK